MRSESRFEREGLLFVVKTGAAPLPRGVPAVVKAGLVAAIVAAGYLRLAYGLVWVVAD
jgi:hypothetical protein